VAQLFDCLSCLKRYQIKEIFMNISSNNSSLPLQSAYMLTLLWAAIPLQHHYEVYRLRLGNAINLFRPSINIPPQGVEWVFRRRHT